MKKLLVIFLAVVFFVPIPELKAQTLDSRVNFSFEDVVGRTLNGGEKNVHLGNIIFKASNNSTALNLDYFSITFTFQGHNLLSNLKLVDATTNQELCRIGQFSFAGVGSNPDLNINNGKCIASLTILAEESKIYKLIGDVGGTGNTIYNANDNYVYISLFRSKIFFSDPQPSSIGPESDRSEKIKVLISEDSSNIEPIEKPIVETPVVTLDPVEKPLVETPVVILEPVEKLNTAVTRVDNILTNRLRGKILLQVESHGEAWYVRPDNGKRIYMKDGVAAYGLMRNIGLGITNADLKKIPIGIEKRFSCADSDEDGLCDKLEAGLGTDPNKKDSDGDGHDDGTEVQNNYDPLSIQKLSYNNNLINRLKGQILLQVESRGEAWYINPDDGKRYYMPDGPAAYEIMRFLSLGISNNNLSGIDTE